MTSRDVVPQRDVTRPDMIRYDMSVPTIRYERWRSMQRMQVMACFDSLNETPSHYQLQVQCFSNEEFHDTYATCILTNGNRINEEQ